MAEHARSFLRRLIAQRLQGLPSTAARVYPSRTWPLAKVLDEGAVLLVYFRGGNSQFDAAAAMGSDRPLLRDERLIVEGHVRGIGIEPDDLLDQIAVEVESKLMADEDLNDSEGEARLEFLGLIDTNIEANADSALRQGRIRLTFRIVYRTASGNPTQLV